MKRDVSKRQNNLLSMQEAPEQNGKDFEGIIFAIFFMKYPCMVNMVFEN